MTTPRTKIATKTIAEDTSVLTIQFTSGDQIVADINALSPEIIHQLALHGLSQKLGDSYSGEQDIEVAKAKANTVLERLVAGDWKAARAASAAGKITDLARALAEVTGQEIVACVEKLSDLAKADRGKFRKHPQIAAKLAAYQNERAQAKAAAAEASGETIDLAGC